VQIASFAPLPINRNLAPCNSLSIFMYDYKKVTIVRIVDIIQVIENRFIRVFYLEALSCFLMMVLYDRFGEGLLCQIST
jgi:hypothetical protein